MRLEMKKIQKIAINLQAECIFSINAHKYEYI